MLPQVGKFGDESKKEKKHVVQEEANYLRVSPLLGT